MDGVGADGSSTSEPSPDATDAMSAAGAGDPALVSLVAEQAAAIARLEAQVAHLKAGAHGDGGATPPWGTPTGDHDGARLPAGAQVVQDAGVDDQVDDAQAAWGTPDQHADPIPGRPASHDKRSTAAEVDKVCQEIASGARWPKLSGHVWQVLDVVGTSRALLLADRVVGTRPYHDEQVAVTWRGCDLRRWLNDEFCDSLGEPLVSRVLTAKVRNEPNPVWGTRGGLNTKDQIFLLSMREAAVYLKGKEPDIWESYRHAFLSLGTRGVAKSRKGKRIWWWLRSPGLGHDFAARVLRDGGLGDGGDFVSEVSGGVRPAFWLDLQS